MKKIVVASVVIIVLVIASVSLVYARGDLGFGIKQCPEEWYDNRMPPVDTSHNNQYLIVNGERRETREFNLRWIKSHCEVTGPSVVE